LPHVVTLLFAVHSNVRALRRFSVHGSIIGQRHSGINVHISRIILHITYRTYLTVLL